jgi:hypothetical protein
MTDTKNTPQRTPAPTAPPGVKVPPPPRPRTNDDGKRVAPPRPQPVEPPLKK